MIRDLFRTMVRLVQTGRRWWMDFANSNFHSDWLLYAAWQLKLTERFKQPHAH